MSEQAEAIDVETSAAEDAAPDTAPEAPAAPAGPEIPMVPGWLDDDATPEQPQQAQYQQPPQYQQYQAPQPPPQQQYQQYQQPAPPAYYQAPPQYPPHQQYAPPAQQAGPELPNEDAWAIDPAKAAADYYRYVNHGLGDVRQALAMAEMRNVEVQRQAQQALAAATQMREQLVKDELRRAFDAFQSDSLYASNPAYRAQVQKLVSLTKNGIAENPRNYSMLRSPDFATKVLAVVRANMGLPAPAKPLQVVGADHRGTGTRQQKGGKRPLPKAAVEGMREFGLTEDEIREALKYEQEDDDYWTED